jgi:hypothetical protein
MGDPIGSYSRPVETWCLADFRGLKSFAARFVVSLRIADQLSGDKPIASPPGFSAGLKHRHSSNLTCLLASSGGMACRGRPQGSRPAISCDSLLQCFG